MGKADRAGSQATQSTHSEQPQRETMATSASNAKTNKRNMHNDANKSDAGSKTNNQHDDESGNDAASQEMFEKMFMNDAAKKRTVMGGAMFVDLSRGQFFQRAFLESKIEDLRTEMTEGLPTMTLDDSGVSTTLPFGTWEVRLIETNADDSSITVTFCAGDEDGETADDEDSKALRSKLRVERTFQMPSTADLASAEVTIDGRRVTVTASDKDKTAPKGMRPSSPISIVDGEQAMPMQIEIE